MSRAADQQFVEKLETLDGSRRAGVATRRKAAVRVQDLDGLLQLPQRLQSVALELQSLDAADPGGPTSDEYDALRADVVAIGAALNTLIEDVGKLFNVLLTQRQAIQARQAP